MLQLPILPFPEYFCQLTRYCHTVHKLFNSFKKQFFDKHFDPIKWTNLNVYYHSHFYTELKTHNKVRVRKKGLFPAKYGAVIKYSLIK